MSTTGENSPRNPALAGDRTNFPAKIVAGGEQELLSPLREQIRFRRLFEAAQDGILLIDAASGNIAEANPYISELLRFPRDELIGKQLWEIGVVADESASRAAFEALRQHGFIRYDNLPLRSRTGEVLEVEYISTRYEECGAEMIQCHIRDITARRTSERTLSEQARLLDLSNDAIIVRDVRNRITYWNHAAHALFGWTREEAIGQDLHALLKTEFEAPLDELMAKLRQEDRMIGEVVQTARNGRRLTLLCRWSLDRDWDGNPASILTTATDISDRKAAEQALHRTQETLANILESISDGFHAVDSNGRFTQFNRAARTMFAAQGIDVDTLLGKRVFDEVLLEARDSAIGHAMIRALSTHVATSAVTYYEPWQRWIDVRHYPTLDGGVATFFQDITERQQAAEAMLESENRFRTLADNIDQLAWMADATGWIFWYNQRWSNYTGATLEEMKGWGWSTAHDPDHLERVTEKWGRHLRAGEEWEDTFPLRGKDGQYRWFRSRAVPIRDESGKVVRWFGTNTDVNDQRAVAEALAQAKEQAEAASRAKDQFLAALSHELRTPLTPVLLTATAFRDDERLPSDTREQLGMIERNITLEARLIDDLLDLTTISHGKLKIRLKRCNPHELVESAAGMVAPDARAKEISLNFVPEGRHTSIMADPTRFQQVIWNLLRNAVKFTPQGGQISVRTHEEKTAAGTWLRIEVADSGIGIDPKHLDRIFQPFEQGELTGDHRFGGMGLGLAIARAVVIAHGGRIRAESAGANHGATFIVELPGVIDSASSFATAPPVTAAEVKPIGSLRLLLVEDHESTLQALFRLLERDGHRIVTATTLADAVIAATSNQFDLVVSDLGLPDGSGIDLMINLRATYGLRGIALSGYGMEADIARSREAGFITHLVKPVAITDLRRALASISSTGQPVGDSGAGGTDSELPRATC